MNKSIDFTKLGGYPLAQEDLDWMQSSYRTAFGAIAQLVGDNIIVSGMVEVSGTVSNGWVSIGGELLPFVGGAIGAGKFMIQEVATALVFNDGNSKEVLFERIARFSIGGPYDYADLKRPGTIATGLVPAGAIMMWSGVLANIPAGWALCDGTNGTPNLSGKFIVGYDETDGNFDTIGNTGGEKSHSLTMNEMPAHSHNVIINNNEGEYYVNDTGSSGSKISLKGDGDNSGSAIPIRTNTKGSGMPFGILPPFYTLAYIMKTA